MNITAMKYAVLDKADAVKDWLRWHLREKRTQRRSTTLAYEEDRVGFLGGVVAVVSVLAAVALALGGFYLAVVGAA